MQFWPPDDEHMCSKYVEAWNKLIVKQKFCASSWLSTEISIILCYVACPALPNVSTYLINDHNFRKKKRKCYCTWNVCFNFLLQFLSEIFILLRTERDTITNVRRSSGNSTLDSCKILIRIEFFRKIFKRNSNITKICLAGTHSFHAHRRADRNRLGEGNSHFWPVCEHA